MPLSLRSKPEFGASREDMVDDSVDVPAAVVCAVCGDAACPGCEREESRSGIVALIPWERSGAAAGGTLGRLWSTARATTMCGDTFFDILPDGPVVPALRFALLAEMFAACGFMLSFVPLVAIVAPSWVAHVLVDAAARELVLRLSVVGIPSLALLLVAAHAAHGLALDRGARRVGGRSNRARALRFGLYATGWDLVMGPIGAVVLAVKEGFGSTVALFGLAVGLPGRCTRAFLRGAYHLDAARIERANRTATAMAVMATFVGAILILAAVAAAMLAGV
jgi:hypothetical protein